MTTLRTRRRVWLRETTAHLSVASVSPSFPQGHSSLLAKLGAYTRFILSFLFARLACSWLVRYFTLAHSVFSSGLLSASSFQFFCIISAINVSPFHQIVHSSDSIGHFFHSSCLGVLVFLLTSHPPAIHSRVPSPLANSLAGHRGRQYRGYIHCDRRHIDKTSSSSLILPIDILNSR